MEQEAAAAQKACDIDALPGLPSLEDPEADALGAIDVNSAASGSHVRLTSFPSTMMMTDERIYPPG